MFATLFTVPSSTTFLGGLTDYSSGMFDTFLPILYIVGGILIGAMIVSKLLGTTVKGAKKVLGGGRKGRGRRR